MMQQQHIAQVLTSIPMFSDLNRDELKAIILIAMPVDFQAGETVCDQDEPGDAMFVIASGRANVTIKKEHENYVPVAKLGPGELIGELALIDAQPRSARVVSVTKLETLKLRRADFIKLKDQHHPATYKIMKRIVRTVCARLRATNTSIVNAINPDLPELLPDPPSARPQTFWQGLLEKVRGGHE